MTILFTGFDPFGGERVNPALRGGFIHVPYIPEQTEGKPEGTRSMELGAITRALEVAARVIAQGA